MPDLAGEFVDTTPQLQVAWHGRVSNSVPVVHTPYYECSFSKEILLLVSGVFCEWELATSPSLGPILWITFFNSYGGTLDDR